MRRFPRPCTGPERAHGGGSRLPRLAHLEDEMDAGSDPRQIAAIFDRARGDYIAPLLWAKYVAFLTEREADAEASPFSRPSPFFAALPVPLADADPPLPRHADGAIGGRGRGRCAPRESGNSGCTLRPAPSGPSVPRSSGSTALLSSGCKCAASGSRRRWIPLPTWEWWRRWRGWGPRTPPLWPQPKLVTQPVLRRPRSRCGPAGRRGHAPPCALTPLAGHPCRRRVRGVRRSRGPGDVARGPAAPHPAAARAHSGGTRHNAAGVARVL